MSWNIIKSDKDINELLCRFNHFHDSVLKEMNYSSGSFIEEDLNMIMVNNPKAHLIFQRQESELPMIELLIEDIININIKPRDSSYTPEIYRAELYKKEDVIYWSEDVDYTNKNDCFWFAAKLMRWRERKNHFGDNYIFFE